MSLRWKNCFYNLINVTNIYGVIRPFYYVAKFFGFAPFQLNDEQLSHQNGITSSADWIIILFSLCGYLYIMFILCNWGVNVENLEEHIIVMISRGILYIIVNFMSIVCMVTNIVFRKDLLKVANDIHRIDNKVKYRLILSLSQSTYQLYLAA